MALYLETSRPNGRVVFDQLKAGPNSVIANTGDKYRVIDAGTGEAQTMDSAPVGDDLLVADAEQSVRVELYGFYRDDKDDGGCELIGPEGSVIAATSPPEVLMGVANKTAKGGDNGSTGANDDGLSTIWTIVSGVLAVGAAAAIIDSDNNVGTVANDAAGGDTSGVVGDGDSASAGDNAGVDGTDDGSDNTGDGDDAGGSDNTNNPDNADTSDNTGGVDNTETGDNAENTGGGENTNGGNGNTATPADNPTDADNGAMVPAAPTVHVEGADENIGCDELVDGTITVSGTTDACSDVTVFWLGKLYSIGADDEGDYSIDIPIGTVTDGTYPMMVVASNAIGTSDEMTLDISIAATADIPLPSSGPVCGSESLTPEDLIGGDEMVIVHDGNIVIGDAGHASGGDINAPVVETITDCEVNGPPVNLSGILDDSISTGLT